jgi:hypothetical protein
MDYSHGGRLGRPNTPLPLLRRQCPLVLKTPQVEGPGTKITSAPVSCDTDLVWGVFCQGSPWLGLSKHFDLQFPCSTWASLFPRPDPRSSGGRRPQKRSRVARSAAPQGASSLDGFEHDGTRERVGDDEVRGELRIGARSFVSLLVEMPQAPRHSCARIR